jgi:hypothetical protein
MGEAKKEKRCLTGNQSTGVVRTLVNSQETSFSKGIVKPVIGF